MSLEQSEVNTSQIKANAEDTQVSHAAADSQAVEPAEAQSEQERLIKRSTYDRVLQESKGYKSRAQIAEKKLEERDKEEAEKQGKYRELWEAERSKNEANAEKLKLMAIKGQVGSVAARYNCVDVEALLAVADKSFLEWDEETMTLNGVDAFVESAMASKPYLFQQEKKPFVNATVPGGNPGVKNVIDQKKFASLSGDEKSSILTDKLKEFYAKK